jgi:hypothetical protein
MYHKLTKENNPLYFWMVGLFLIVGWLPLFFDNHPAFINIRIDLFNAVFSGWNLNYSLILFVSFIAVLASAFLFIFISKKFNDVFGILLPSFVFVLLINIYALTNVDFNIFLISPFYVFIIYLLLKIIDLERIYDIVFYIGFLIGMLSIFYFLSCIILAVVILGLVFFKPFNVKELILLLISFFIPFIFVDVYMYVFKATHVFSLLSEYFTTYHIRFLQSFFVLLIVLVFFLFSLNKNAKKIMLKKIKNRKYYNWLIISQVVLWVIMFALQNVSVLFFILVLFSIGFSTAVVSLKKELHAKMLLLCLIILNLVAILIR